MGIIYQILIVDDDYVRVPFIRKYLGRVVHTGPIQITVDHVTTVPESFADYALVCLDHDLGVQDVYDEIRNMTAEQIGEYTAFIVHSMNPIGARNIAAFLNDFPHPTRKNGRATVTPFSKILDIAKLTRDSDAV